MRAPSRYTRNRARRRRRALERSCRVLWLRRCARWVASCPGSTSQERRHTCACARGYSRGGELNLRAPCRYYNEEPPTATRTWSARAVRCGCAGALNGRLHVPARPVKYGGARTLALADTLGAGSWVNARPAGSVQLTCDFSCIKQGNSIQFKCTAIFSECR